MFSRWHHKRGYGVHSPFAFEVILEGVAPRRGYLYYEEEAIDAAPGLSRAVRRNLRLTVRLRALLLRHGMVLSVDPPEGGDAPLPLLLTAIEGERALADAAERLRGRLADSGGLLLMGRDWLLAVERPQMPLQCYNV